MKFIITQSILIKSETKDNQIYNHWDMVIRKVDAESRESAIGKFVIGTQHIKAKEKMDLICLDINEMIQL